MLTKYYKNIHVHWDKKIKHFMTRSPFNNIALIAVYRVQVHATYSLYLSISIYTYIFISYIWIYMNNEYIYIYYWRFKLSFPGVGVISCVQYTYPKVFLSNISLKNYFLFYPFKVSWTKNLWSLRTLEVRMWGKRSVMKVCPHIKLGMIELI